MFITIMIMVLVDYLMGIPSPKLNVPDRFEVGACPILPFFCECSGDIMTSHIHCVSYGDSFLYKDKKMVLLSASAFSLQPTSKNRGWLIDPLGDNPWWTLLVAALPALLCTILIFMDQQITAVIINRKEHKLKVGHACVPSELMLKKKKSD